jgi:hypothetical protein
MADVDPGAAEPLAKASGVLGKLLAKASPEELRDLLADSVLSKAGEHGLLEGQVSADPYKVDDIWDGPPDTMPGITRVTRGASKPSPGGSLQVGKPQAASGDGAMRMQETYSPDIAMQSGVAASVERFGEEMSRMREAAKAADRKITMLGHILSKSIGDFSAISGKLDTLIAKAGEWEKKEEKEEKEDEKEEKSAARLLAQAKTHLSDARKAVTKSINLRLDGSAADADILLGTARTHFAKARQMHAALEFLAPGHAELAPLAKSFEAVLKALPKNEAENQDKWPDAGLKPVGKAAEENEEEEEMEKAMRRASVKSAPATQAAPDNSAMLAAATDKIAKSLEGINLLSTDIRGLMSVVQGQSTSAPGLPPAFALAALAKSDPDGFVRDKQNAIRLAVNNGALTQTEADSARDILGNMQAAARGQLDDSIVAMRLRTAPPTVRALFERAA